MSKLYKNGRFQRGVNANDKVNQFQEQKEQSWTKGSNIAMLPEQGKSGKCKFIATQRTSKTKNGIKGKIGQNILSIIFAVKYLLF